MNSALGVILILWLALCAWRDWHKRQVSNWLTLPPLILAVALRWSGLTSADLPLMLLVLLTMLVGWLGRWVGGADVKVTAALVLLDTRLALAAWMGAAAWYILLFCYGRFVARDSDRIRLPGMLGFLIGVGGFVLWL